MFGGDDGLDVAPHVEITPDSHPCWRRDPNEVVEDGVDGSLVEHMAVAEAVDVELERLELHDVLRGHILDSNRGKVRKSRTRAETGEFWAIVADEIGSI